MEDADEEPEQFDVADGCGCAEVWDALSERRRTDDDAATDGDTGDSAEE